MTIRTKCLWLRTIALLLALMLANHCLRAEEDAVIRVTPDDTHGLSVSITKLEVYDEVDGKWVDDAWLSIEVAIPHSNTLFSAPVACADLDSDWTQAPLEFYRGGGAKNLIRFGVKQLALKNTRVRLFAAKNGLGPDALRHVGAVFIARKGFKQAIPPAAVIRLDEFPITTNRVSTVADVQIATNVVDKAKSPKQIGRNP